MRNVVTVTSARVQSTCAIYRCVGLSRGFYRKIRSRRTEAHWKYNAAKLAKKNAREIGKTRRRVREGDEPRSVEVYKRARDDDAPHSSWRTITSIHRIRDTDADTWLFRYICPMALSLKWHRESGRDRGRDGERKRQRCDPHPLRPPFPVVALSIINLEKPLIPGALLFRHHFGLTASNDVKLILAANAWRRMKNGIALATRENEKCANREKIAEFGNGLISSSDQ